MPRIVSVPYRFIGREYDDTSGVQLLVDAVFAPQVSAWRPGESVAQGRPLARGTAIALFTNGRFTLASDQDLHGCIYIGQNTIGIDVVDVLLNGKVVRRTIQWTANNTDMQAVDFAAVEW